MPQNFSATSFLLFVSVSSWCYYRGWVSLQAGPLDVASEEWKGDDDPATDNDANSSFTDASHEPSNLPQNSSVPRRQRPVSYSGLRKDRSGAAIQDMLMAHAYCFANNYTYGGACHADLSYDDERLRDHNALIDTLGLRNEIQIVDEKCAVVVNESSGMLLEFDEYRGEDTGILTQEWVDHVSSVVNYLDDDDKDAQVKKVAVHIRRGDVSPCNPMEGTMRYVPNSHYLNVIDLILGKEDHPENVQVSIFSQTESFESFDAFLERNYSLQLDTNLSSTWESMMMADVLVLSKSSFSLIPAVLNRGEVYYTPFWHKPLPGWKIVPEPMVSAYLKERDRLANQHC